MYDMSLPHDYTVDHLLSPERYQKNSYHEMNGMSTSDGLREHGANMMHLGYGQRYVPTAGFKRRSRSELSLEWSCIEPGCGRRYEQWRR